jgi:hypothetical protein
VREQFWKTVAPMHDRFVAPQVFDADIILKQPSEAAEIENLAETIRALVSEDDLTMPNDSSADWPWPARSKTVRHQRFPRGRRHGLEAVAVNHVN